MNKRLLFSAVAATAWAQQTNPGAAKVEKALRDRVQQYYTLMMAKKYRQAEAMVAQESRDDYYNGKKPDIRGFEITKVELSDKNTRATVTLKAKVLMLMPGAGAQIFEMPAPTHWKLEHGAWLWYVPEELKSMTPFGKLRTGESAGAGPEHKGEAPPVDAIQNQITVSRQSVVLQGNGATETVEITNHLPGPTDLVLDSHVATIRGLTVEIEQAHLAAGQKTRVRISRTGSEKIQDTIQILAKPLNRLIEIPVKAD